MDGLDERGFSRPLQAAAAALALAGLLAIVAIVASSGHPGGHGRLHQRQVPAQVANDLLTILVITFVLGVLGVLATAYWLRGEWKRPNRSWWRQLLMLVVFFCSISLLGYRLTHIRRSAHHQIAAVQTSERGVNARARTLPNLPAANRPAQLDWVLAAVIGGGLVLAAVVVLARRRDEFEGHEGETVEEELSAVVSDAIDDLRREADPRRAVIAAYARMERALGRHGHPRDPSEAPFEYLARILVTLRVRAAAVSDLTELFERAKFSTHEIDRPMKERAIAALVSVRDDLQAAPA